MAELKGTIQGACATSDAINSGIAKCQTTLDLVKTLLICDVDTRFSVEPDTFNEELRAAIVSGKVVPINGVIDAQPTGGDVRTSEVGYGGAQPNGTNALSVQYRIEANDLCLGKELSKLDGAQKRFLWVDDKGMIFGTVKTDANGDYITGYLGKVQSYNTLPQNDSAYAIYLGVYYSSNHSQEWANAAGIAGTVDLGGLVGVKLQVVGGVTTIVTSCGGIEMGSEFANDWDVSAFLNESGANPTTVAVDPNTGAVTLAPAGKYRIAPAAVLDGLGIPTLNGLNVFTTITAP